MNFELTQEQQSIREAVNRLCTGFPESYWRERDIDGVFPHDFYKAMGEAGWLGLAIPEQYGGAGLGVQEAAVLAVKADVREELDRLNAHIAAARTLLGASGTGRRLDFLAQEFMREANTLCSKSATTALTAIGLELKAVIEQLREQIQNVE